MGVYEFTEGAQAELELLNTKPVAPSESVTVSDEVPAGLESSTILDTKGVAQISVITSDLATDLTVEIRLLDDVEAELHTMQSITANGFNAITLAWPKIAVVRKNDSAAPAVITVAYATR